jgi:hypothetical protein
MTPSECPSLTLPLEANGSVHVCGLVTGELHATGVALQTIFPTRQNAQQSGKSRRKLHTSELLKCGTRFHTHTETARNSYSVATSQSRAKKI